jgi:hypothetical protein
VTLIQFVAKPWANSHPHYEESPFNIRPAPEFATSEVIVASLYRNVGFAAISEGRVPSAGREFDRLVQKEKPPRNVQPGVSLDTWRAVLHGLLESPKQPNQSSRRFLSLCPLVPDISLYAGTARQAANSWNPGLLVARMISLGSPSAESASKLWSQLFEALSVSAHDDIWARWLQQEFEKWRTGQLWEKSEVALADGWTSDAVGTQEIPARQFVRDLEATLEAKLSMTRRQWISVLDAVLRIGAVAHVLWLCDSNARIWEAVREAILNGRRYSDRDVAEGILSRRRSYLTYGNPGLPAIRDTSSAYLHARVGINLTLWAIDASPGPLRSYKDIASLLHRCAEKRDELLGQDFFGTYSRILEAEPRALLCKKGVGNNLVEFGRHVLGQRQTADESLRNYDQGFFLRKKASYSSAPWVVSLGPVAILALVHCCLREAVGPRSVQRLCQHLAQYGIEVDLDDVSRGELGQKLRMLGLVLDSPDAESGVLLVDSFPAGPRLPEAL